MRNYRPKKVREALSLRPREKQRPVEGFIAPQLALLSKDIPKGSNWLHEIKFDGYRTLCRVGRGRVQLLTRSGLDWTEAYGPLKDQVKKLGLKSALLDGEIIWTDPDGKPDFQGLQNALSEGRSDRLVYYIFDILNLNGKDLRPRPLLERKELLRGLMKKKIPQLAYSEHFVNAGEQLFAQNCGLHMEGIISKDGGAPYTSGRGPGWRKIKCANRQEFVIGGYALSNAADGRSIRSLLMGVYEGKELRFAGKIGTGYTQQTLRELARKLKPLETDESPFTVNSPRGAGIRWVKPKLVGEVQFSAWTDEGIIRHGSFQGLRGDKKTAEVRKEVPSPAPAGGAVPGTVAGVRITHPERVVYPKAKVTKLDVIRFYDYAYPQMKPFLNDRPLSLLRCQETSTGVCFFQKHAEGRNLKARSKEVHYKAKKDSAILAETRPELIQLVQAGAIEIHGWGATFKKIEKPDLIVFDLDPETMKIWPLVIETAHRIRQMLLHLGLKSFVKTTGGKGLHIHVPLVPEHDWDQVKHFSKSLMQVLEEHEPHNYTTNMVKAKRKNRIFLDYLRNGYGATAVVPFSVRAREMPTVAVPISWKQVTVDLDPGEYTVSNIEKKLKKRRDPWADYWDLKQRLKI